MKIEGSKHSPVGAHLVPELVEELCDYINDHWNSSAFHLAAYAMWRLNWIHPFADGNGQTSRILSFTVFSIKIGTVLPGTPTLPDLIVDHRQQYEDALDTADAAFAEGRVDVSRMEELVSALVARQLTNVHDMASGKA